LIIYGKLLNHHRFHGGMVNSTMEKPTNASHQNKKLQNPPRGTWRILPGELTLELEEFSLMTPRASGYAQDQKYDCHTNQEAKVILAAVVVNFVHLHSGVEK
jgi:hypothetical protein